MPQKNEIYRHYKGNRYEVVCVAKHSESLEELVVYCDIARPEKIWARPLSMWNETVEVGGKILPRFAKEE